MVLRMKRKNDEKKTKKKRDYKMVEGIKRSRNGMKGKQKKMKRRWTDGERGNLFSSERRWNAGGNEEWNEGGND